MEKRDEKKSFKALSSMFHYVEEVSFNDGENAFFLLMLHDSVGHMKSDEIC